MKKVTKRQLCNYFRRQIVLIMEFIILENKPDLGISRKFHILPIFLLIWNNSTYHGYFSGIKSIAIDTHERGEEGFVNSLFPIK